MKKFVNHRRSSWSIRAVPAEEVGDRNPTSVFDDLESLRKQSKLTVKRKSILVNVTVDKPPNNSYSPSQS